MYLLFLRLHYETQRKLKIVCVIYFKKYEYFLKKFCNYNWYGLFKL